MKVTKIGAAQMAMDIRIVKTTYPDVARQSHVESVVQLRTLIYKDGSVIDVKYVSDPETLIQSAMDAVKQWKFKPILSENSRVPVECEFNIDFKLGDS